MTEIFFFIAVIFPDYAPSFQWPKLPRLQGNIPGICLGNSENGMLTPRLLTCGKYTLPGDIEWACAMRILLANRVGRISGAIFFRDIGNHVGNRIVAPGI
jgi:hypothetical protein